VLCPLQQHFGCTTTTDLQRIIHALEALLQVAALWLCYFPNDRSVLAADYGYSAANLNDARVSIQASPSSDAKPWLWQRTLRS
jgi:hypothetical protein